MVTGATRSSAALIKSVTKCAEQAQGDIDLLKANRVELKAGPDEEYTTDVVVVGFGASGFMAAHNAAVKGAKVMAIEKGAMLAATNGLKVIRPLCNRYSCIAGKELQINRG